MESGGMYLMTASTESSTQSHHDEKEAIAPARLVAYALGNFGQSAFYNALSTYFVPGFNL